MDRPITLSTMEVSSVLLATQVLNHTGLPDQADALSSILELTKT